MKKFVLLLVAVMLCVSMVCPVLAAEDDFVPSITYKGAPDVVVTEDAEGNPAVGVITDAEGEVLGYVAESALKVTPLSGEDEEIVAVLEEIYEELVAGTMTLPYEGDKDMVIMDLVDVSLENEDDLEMVEPEGAVFTVTFKLGVAAGVEVTAMTYKNDAWNPVAKVVNNGDGTVTCTFEHLCPVAFSVAAEDAPSETGDETDMMLWSMLLAVSAVGMAVVSVLYFRTRKKA